jgi:hypothetical protein
MRCWNDSGARITGVFVVVPVTDTFINTWRGTANETIGSREIARTDPSATVNYSGKSAKYARFYVINASGTKQNSWDTNLLEVTYNGTAANQAGSQNTNGVYISDANGINFDNLSVTLKAGAGNIKNYKVVTILSNDAMTGTQEPAWDEQYTYSYTYPLDENYILNYTLTDDEASQSSFFVEKQSEIFQKLNNTNAYNICSHWYNRWYVLDANGTMVSNLSSSNATSPNSNWNFLHYYLNEDNTTYADWPVDRWLVQGNYVVGHSGQGNNSTEGWFVERTLARHVMVTAPSGILSDYPGYQIVFELDHEYNGNPDIKLRYIFSIPNPDPFLNKAKATMTSGSSTQEVALEDFSASFTMDAAASAQKGDSFSGTAKYVRVVLKDASGNAIDPQGKLTVSYNGTAAVQAGEDAVNGLYIYNNGGDLDLSLLNVTLTTGVKSLSSYSIVAYVSIDEATTDGTTVTKEPAWDYQFTFGFQYPCERIRLDLIRDSQLGENAVNLDIWSTILAKLEKADAAAFFATNTNYTKWYIEDANGNRQPLVYNSNAEDGKWATTKNGQNIGSVANDEYYWKSADGWSQNYHKVGLFDSKTPSGTTLENFRGYRFICEVSDEFDGTNAVPKVIYWIPIPDYFVSTLKANGTQVEETVILEEDTKTYTLTQLQTQYEAFATAQDVSPTDQVYIRLYAANIDGTLAADQSVFTFDNLPAGFTQIEQGWAYLGQALTADQIAALAAATVTSTQNLYDTGRKVGLVMAKAPFDDRFYPTDAAGASTIINEPKWDYQYLLRFDQFLTTDGPTMIEETVTVRPGNADNEGRYTFNIADIAALSAGAKGFDAKYMRWYLADSNGNIVNPQTYTQGGGGPDANVAHWFITDVNTTPHMPGLQHDHNEVNRASDNAKRYGQMWWLVNGNTVEFDDLQFKVTTPTFNAGWGGTQHYDLQNYQVVVYLSDNDDESMLTETVTTGPGPANTNTYVTKEPTPDYKIVIKFNSFFGDLDSDATKIEQTFRQPTSDWNEECATGAREYVISFDYAAKTVTMAKADGTGTPMTKSMSDEEYAFWSTFTNNTGTVPYNTNFYFRWYLRNKATGEVAQIQNSIVSADGGSALQDVVQYTNYGFYYMSNGNRAPGSKYFCNYFTDQGKDMATLLRVKLDGSPTGGECFSITDYDLVLLLNSTDKGDGAQATPWGETNQHYCLVREPVTFDLQYTFHFKNDFEADNIDDPKLKTKYKTLIYDPVTRSATPTIISNYHEMAGDLQVGKNDLAAKGYARWYLVSKATGEPIPMGGFTPADQYTSLGGANGYYRYKFAAENLHDRGGYYHGYDPTITLPEGVRYQDVRIVCVMTTLTEPQEDNENLPKDLPAREPRQMQVKYVYDLVLEETLRYHWPFIHYHGVHYPEYHRSFEDSREFIGPDSPNDLPAEGTASVNQLVWDYGRNTLYNPADNSYEAKRIYNHGGHNPDPASPDYTTRDIRQNVHVKEYNYYLLLGDGEQETLKLPFQYYDGDSHGVDNWGNQIIGSDTEPIGYIRWYDWNTDTNSEHIIPAPTTAAGTTPHETELRHLMSQGVDRGWYTIMSSTNPTQEKVGVDFVAPEGFSNSTNEIVIACDVSRYMDGLDDSKRYLVHEPTLSIRYIYHILPAKVMAAKMVADANKYFNPVMAELATSSEFSVIENYEKTFHLMENNGRTVVSLDSIKGNFSLRTSLTEIGHYYVKVGSELKPCNNLQWYAYYEYEGKLYRLKVNMAKAASDWTVASSAEKYNPGGAVYQRDESRLAIFELKDFWGEYELVGNTSQTSQTKTFHIQPGQFIHLVGCLGYKDPGSDNITEVPTVSTELFFVDAAPQALGAEPFARTDYSMSTEYKKAAELKFDDFFDDPTTRYNKPLTSFENYADIPMLFPDAQYGFCYPSLYGQCATDYMIHHHGGWEAYGFAPLHGDYTLLKSMNMPGISISRDISYDDAINLQSMYALWYKNAQLYDVTHERANGKNVTETDDYGAYLYVDAADQSRTIGRLEFDAQLCAGAEIYYTAYIADMTDAATTPQVRFRVYTYNTESGYPMGTVVGDKYLEGYESSDIVPVISFVTGDIATEGATTKGQWYQVYGYCNLPPEDRTFLQGDSRHFYVEVDNFCENTNGADYAVDQITFYTSSARVRVAQASGVCDDERGVKLQISALASSILPHFGKGQDREIFYRIYPLSSDPDKTDLEADEAIIGQGVYCHEHEHDDGDRGNLYGAVPFHVGYEDDYATNYDNTLYESLEALLLAKANQPSYLPKYGFYKEGDEVYYLLDERYFELTAGQEYFVSLYTLGSYKPGNLDGWGNPYGNHTCTAYSNGIMPRNMYIELTEDSEVSNGVVDFGCSRTHADKDFGVRVRYPLESGGYQTFTGLPFDFFEGTASDLNAMKDDRGTDNTADDLYLKDALAHFRGLKDGNDYKYATAYTTVPEAYEREDEHEGAYYNLLKYYVDEKKLRLEAASTFSNRFKVDNALTEGINVTYLALPLNPQIDTDKEICSPISMVFYLDPSGGAPLMELGFDDVKYPESYKKRGVRLGLEQLAKMRDKGYMLHIPISSYHDKKVNEDPNTLYFERAQLTLSGTNDPTYLDADGNLTAEAAALIVTEIKAPGADGSSNEEDDGTGVYVSNKRMYLPLSFEQDSEHPENYVNFKEGYWYEVNTRYFDEGDIVEYHEDPSDYCYADLYIVFKVVPEFATWQSQSIGATSLYNVSWHNDQNWKRSIRSDLYKDANAESRHQNTNTAGHPAGYDNDGEGTLRSLTGDLYDANPNPGFVPMKFTYVTMLTGNHAPSLINEARTTVGAVQTGGYLIDPNQTELMTDTSPLDNRESSKATDNIRYDMLVRYGPHNEGGEGCFGHRSKTKTDGVWGWRNDRRSEEQMTQFNTDRKAFDVEKFYGNICKEIYFKPEAELLRQQRLTYEKAWVEKELVANRWYLAASPLKSTYAGDMYVPTTMTNVATNEENVPGQQLTEAFQPINFSKTAVTTTGGTATSTPAYSRTKYPIYQRSWKTDGSKVYTKTNDARATDYSANLGYTTVSEQFVEWSHTYNDVQVPYSTLTGFSIRADRKQHVKTEDGNQVDVPALLRLPKADAQYDYYDWADQAKATGDNAFSQLTQTVSKPNVTLTNSINGTTWNYQQPSQYRFITDDASKDQITQGAMEFSLDDLQVQGDYVLVGNPHVASLNMGEFFGGNPNLAHTFPEDDPSGGDPLADGTVNYSYWTYEGGEVKAFLVDKTTETHVVSTVDGDVEQKTITYAITSGGNNEVGIIRPMQAFFVKKGTADKIFFTRDMTIDGNFPMAVSSGDGNDGGSTGGGSRFLGVTLRAASNAGGSSATVRVGGNASDGYREGEDVETLFDSNLSGVPMVYTVASGQAVSIDQRPQLDVVPFGVTCSSSEPVEVQVTSHLSSLASHLYFVDALTGEQTEVGQESTIRVQPNDYGRYFLTTTGLGIDALPSQEAIVISVRQHQVTVTATSNLTAVSAVTLGGANVFRQSNAGNTCTFQLSPGVYVIDASTAGGINRRMKVVVN